MEQEGYARVKEMVEGEGFEPSKAEPSDLQSDPFGHSGTPPQTFFLALQLTFKIVFQNIINNGLVYQDKTKHWPCLVFENDPLR